MAELDEVLWDLDAGAQEPPEEPSVLVDPAIEAFCVVRPRVARGTAPPPASGRLPLELIRLYMLQNAEPEDDEDEDGP